VKTMTGKKTNRRLRFKYLNPVYSCQYVLSSD